MVLHDESPQPETRTSDRLVYTVNQEYAWNPTSTWKCSLGRDRGERAGGLTKSSEPMQVAAEAPQEGYSAKTADRLAWASPSHQTRQKDRLRKDMSFPQKDMSFSQKRQVSLTCLNLSFSSKRHVFLMKKTCLL